MDSAPGPEEFALVLKRTPRRNKPKNEAKKTPSRAKSTALVLAAPPTNVRNDDRQLAREPLQDVAAMVEDPIYNYFLTTYFSDNTTATATLMLTKLYAFVATQYPAADRATRISLVREIMDNAESRAVARDAMVRWMQDT